MMSGRNTKEGTSSNGGESATKSKNNGRRRKKRGNDGTSVSRRSSSDGPTNVTINGVFLRSIRVEDTKTLDPEDWKKVRDYVINERKKLAGTIGTNDNDVIQNALVEDRVRDESKKSPPENTSANTEANAAVNKSNTSKKKEEKKANGGPTNVTINGVFLKSIAVEDTKTLDPEDWKKVRDYVQKERKKLSKNNGTSDDQNVSQMDSVSTNNVSVGATPAVGDSDVKSPSENMSANTDAVTTTKSNRSKKKRKGENGEKEEANSNGKQNLSSNSNRADGKNNSSNTSRQNEASTRQRPAKSRDAIEQQSRGESKKSPAKKDSATIDVEYLSEQLHTETEQRLAAVEHAKLECARADKLAKQVTLLDQELKKVTKALEKSKSEGKRHLTIQLQLLEASKKELFTVNKSLLAEQSKVATLKSQLGLEMAAKESNAKELDRMKELIASERKKANILREELEQTTTANKSMAQELNDNKLRAERVKKLELELREERAKIAKFGNNPPKATIALRKELHETQEKLKNAKKRNAVLTSELSERSYPQRQQQQTERKKGSALLLATTVADALGSDSKAPKKTSPKLSPKRATSMPAPVEVSLSERASLVNFESAPVHYDGVVIDNDDDGAEESSALQDELTFIRSAFSAEEILVDGNQVTYTLQLPIDDDDSEDLKIDISVILPVRYPTAGINEIHVVVNETSTCCPEFRKIALDALPSVKEICLIEARALEGSAALSSIFSVVDMWAKGDWYSVMAKQLSLSKGKGKPSKNSGGNGSFEICTFLIYTHHIVDPDKIHFVKKSASKLNLGGYMKIGKPGLLLVEGQKSDCEALLDTLLLNRKKLRESHGGKVDSATFMAAGNVVRNATTNSERVLPKKLEQLEAKDGMDKIKDACKISGLLGSLEEVCKR